MFSKEITDTDVFLEMPATAQNLYFHLNMHADDDGFLGNAKTIRRMIGASEDDFKILLAKQFVLTFPDGVTVIRDWHIHNYIQKDRYHPTVYEADKKQLALNNAKRYEVQAPRKMAQPVEQQGISPMDTSCIQHVSKVDTEVRLGKVRLGKDNKINSSSKEERVPYSEIIGYLNTKTGQKLKPTTKAYQKLIRARWNDGYKLQDFKTVIDNKAYEWQGTKFWKYMTPKTLFASSHFDEYLNANKREENSSSHGGFDIDEEAQKKFFEEINSDDLPF